MAGTKCFTQRPADWSSSVQPYYDSAYKMSLRPDMVDGTDDQESAGEIDEKAIRGSFLKFFVSILQSYRKYLVYPSKANPFPKRRFLESEFVASSEADWRDFLQPLMGSQAFHQFIDVRLSRSGWTDPEMIFFDESIDAKINRYTFRLHRHDTPFLTNESNKHTKTYVAPTVDMQGLEAMVEQEQEQEEEVGGEEMRGNRIEKELDSPKASGRGGRRHSYLYTNGFPKLQPHLFVSGNSGGGSGSGSGSDSGRSTQSNLKLFGLSGGSQQRLKRVSTLRLPFSRGKSKASGPGGSSSSSLGSGEGGQEATSEWRGV